MLSALRRVAAFCLCLALCFGLAACDGGASATPATISGVSVIFCCMREPLHGALFQTRRPTEAC